MGDERVIRIAALALTVPLLSILALLLRDLHRMVQPMRLLLRGSFGAAHAAALTLERSWLGVFRNVRQTARYNAAVALHLDGKLDESIAAIAALRVEPIAARMLRHAAPSLEAASLVLLERDPARVRELVAEATRIYTTAEDRLLSAHASLALGEEEDARALFDSVRDLVPRQRIRIGRVVTIGNEVQDAAFHTLRALWLLRAGRIADAQRDLSLAAKGSIDSVYVRIARARLDARPAEAEAPSSLAPQVVSTRSRPSTPDGA